MGQGHLASHQKKAARLNAHIVFLDESGFLMAPLVRRTWSPRGQTPILFQCGRYRQKASAIAVLSISPRRRRVGLFFSLASDRNVDGPWMIDFLRDLLRHLPGPVILIWDLLNVHRSRFVSRYRQRCSRLHVEWLPPYAPELNPVEGLWGYMKQNPLANFAASDANHLATIVCRQARRLERRTSLLRSFIHRSRLSLRLK